MILDSSSGEKKNGSVKLENIIPKLMGREEGVNKIRETALF